MSNLRFRAFYNGKMYKVACINFFTEILWLDLGEDDRPVCAIKDAILMQSTGRQDKNGAEIFEGDILESGCTFKVIGNIHQNPELLEQGA